MPIAFSIIAGLIIVSAVAAMSFRNLIHCALSLIVTFLGLACLYLQLHAEFVGLAQVLVYVGAVGILIVFAVLLTRNSTNTANTPILSPSSWMGLLIALFVMGGLLFAITRSTALPKPAALTAEVTTQQIGAELMTRYVLPLEVIALLLTAAMLGAVIIALPRSRSEITSETRKEQP